MVEMINANKILVRKTERRQLGKPRRGWNCSIKWTLNKWDWDCGNETSGSLKCGEFLTGLGPVSFLRTVLHVAGSWVS